MIHRATQDVQDDDLIGLYPVEDQVITLYTSADTTVFGAWNQPKALGEIRQREACQPAVPERN